MTFSKKEKHTCIWGDERWVRDNINWVLFKHHLLTIKLHKIIYMSMSANQWVHQKDTCMYKENYTTWRDNDFFKESKTYMYIGGAEKWVRNDLIWVLFKHHSLNIRLHKIVYVNFIKSWMHQNDTCKYKENYTTWRDNDFFKESETYMYLGGRGGSLVAPIGFSSSTTHSLEICIK